MSGVRLSVRLRLTLLYGAMFLAAGATLLTINYELARRNLPQAETIKSVAVRANDDTGSGDQSTAPDVSITPTGKAEKTVTVGAGVVAGGRVNVDTATLNAQRFRDETLHQLVLQSGLALLVTAALSILLGWFVAGRALRPVHTITAAARNLSEHNLHARLNLSGPHDELKELADTFDDMLGRLEDTFDSQQRFIANASHELRTPLSILRTELELSRRDPVASSEDAAAANDRLLLVIDRAQHTINALLVLAKSSTDLAANDPVDLADVVEVAVAELEAELAATDIELVVDLRTAPTRGDGVLLEHLASNLVANAVRYNMPGGSITLHTHTDGSHAVFEISNTGPILDAEVVPTLVEPFRRNAPDRTKNRDGAGLGLSIVHAVAVAHGGDVHVEPLPEGGLHVTVRLPAVPADV